MTEPERQAQYIESYKSFDKEMVDHFPKKIPNNWRYIVFGSTKYINENNNTTELILKIQITSKEKFKRLKNKLSEKAKEIRSSADSCLLIVDSKESQNVYNCDHIYPIPHETIFDYDDGIEKWIKVEDCELVLLDYKSGKFIESEYLTEKENLPKDWKNGYSKGYAFNNNEQTVIYWLIVW